MNASGVGDVRDAIVLAAGRGRRLGALTMNRPKALVKLAGRPLLSLVMSRLYDAGVRHVVVNAHYRARLIKGYLAANCHPGMHVEVSVEKEILGTGGGVKHMGEFFPTSVAPIIIYSVDILSTIDLQEMVGFHVRTRALATLAVQRRPAARHLLFDEEHQLRGWRRISSRKGTPSTPDRQGLEPLAFCGIHVVGPELFHLLTETGSFSIMASYIRLAALGERIVGFAADSYYWRDVGTVTDLTTARRDLTNSVRLFKPTGRNPDKVHLSFPRS